MLSRFPLLTTERLTLRQPRESDAQEIFSLRSDTMVNKYLGRKPCETAEQALSFIRNVNENSGKHVGFYWAITNTGSEKLIGTICLFGLSNEHKNGEIGYELLPGYQGQGIMNEALKKIIGFAFHTLKLDTMDAFTHINNQRSTKLLQKFHFEKTEVNDESNPNLILFRLLNAGPDS